MTIESEFQRMRNDSAHHIGLGDIRLTLAEQSNIIKIKQREIIQAKLDILGQLECDHILGYTLIDRIESEASRLKALKETMDEA